MSGSNHITFLVIASMTLKWHRKHFRCGSGKEWHRRALELSPDLEGALEALQHAEGLLSQAACIQTLKGHTSQVHDVITLQAGWHLLLCTHTLRRSNQFPCAAGVPLY